ncbi:class I SAM-dependent methyltransferase [Acinetobacter kyonggiensis]|uniref:Methyltransferase domain-containing protein n=1 Tax=Acinetobacter kyonggiensis TaxID=595670 RepID=A0A1H3FFT7_9GAMM|nr:class I SAM-dependent methyltransferase [Acinetobacter kyonggiensis]SDX89826.1 Methyltransferase domain-containing protein [Acinetobacter kyonggiensis]
MKNQFESAQNIIEIYKKHARAWTELRGNFLYEKTWLDHFLSFIPQHSEILDLGCGSGKPIADYLIQHDHKIIAVDSSDVMIEMARQNFPEQRWLQADMRTVELDQKFNAILAWDSFFHLTPNDQRQMFSQFTRFAQQGTALMFSSGPSHGEAIGDLFGDALYHASLAPEEYTALLNDHGFQVIKMVVEDVECTGHTVWLAQKLY